MPRLLIVAAVWTLLSAGCAAPDSMETSLPSPRVDAHSYANSHQVRVSHVHLELDVDFERKQLEGEVTLELQGEASELVLDTRDLEIHQVTASLDGDAFSETEFELGRADKILGAPLRIVLPADASHVRLGYRTSPQATGLQWLEAPQTAGKRQPYLYSQSQAIHARSWIPLQDSPTVRATYSATVRTPPKLTAVMSAESSAPGRSADGEYRFQMPQPIPSYLIALAVGDLTFEPMSERTGVWAEPSVVEAAAQEFADTEAMMQAVESLFGPYRWGRYDILVLPPSFPYGGMENPRLTFATPTLIAGDRSLVNVIAHELAHSWSGNLVTNATWRDFWLNEGFTVYLENRIQEAVFGRARAEMEADLEVAGLREELADLEARDQILHIDLRGRDPDDGFNQVPYVKGMLLLRTLESKVGREQWDRFLRGYFDHFSFQSIVTEDFLEYLRRELPDAVAAVDLDQWISAPGLPDDLAEPQSVALAEVDRALERWLGSQITAEELPLDEWETQQTLHLLAALPDDLSLDRMAELDRAHQLTQSGNSEIVARWLEESVRRDYDAVQPRLEAFLITVGRRKFLKPLYTVMARTPEGRERAREIYAKARAGYHPIAQALVDQILETNGESQ